MRLRLSKFCVVVSKKVEGHEIVAARFCVPNKKKSENKKVFCLNFLRVFVQEKIVLVYVGSSRVVVRV